MLVFLVLAAAAGPGRLAAQANAIRQNNTDLLDLGTAWSTGAPLTDANIAVWNGVIDGSVPGANTTTVGAGATFGGILISNPAVSITIGAGTGNLTLGNTSVVSAIDLSAATVNLDLAANLVLAGSQQWDVASARVLSVSGLVSGAAGLTKAGAGTVILSGANTFNGLITVNGGQLVAASNGALGGLGPGVIVAPGAALLLQNNITVGAEPLALNGGTLANAGGSNTYGGAITLSASSPIEVTGGSLTLTGAINASTPATLTLNAVGGVTLNGVVGANVTAVTKTGSGALTLGAAGVFQNTRLELNQGALSFGTQTAAALGALSGSVNIALANTTPAAVALTVGSLGQDTSYAGVFSGAGSLTKTGAGVFSLNGANTYTGATTVNAGTLEANFAAGGAPASNIFSPTSAMTLNGGHLRLTGAGGGTNSQTLNGLTLGAATASNVHLNLNGAASLLLTTGAITRGAAALVNFDLPAGAGVATTTTGTNGILTGTAGVAFATLNGTDWAGLNSGSLVIPTYQTNANPAAWTDADNVSLAGDPATTLGNTTINTLRFSAGSNLAINSTDALTLGAGGLLVTGSGSNAIAGGTLLGSGGIGKELVVIQHNTANPLALFSVIADNGGATALTKFGNGILTLGGANTYTGGTSIVRGTIALGANDVLPGIGTMNVAGGTLNLGAFNDTIGALTVTNGGTVTGSGTLTIAGLTLGTGTISANLSGTGAVTKGTSGNVSFTSTSTLGGLTLTNGGIIVGPGANWTSGGGTIGLANNGAPVAGDVAGMLIINGGNFTTNGAFTVNSSTPNTSPTSGIMVLAGNATFNGGLTITNSTGQNTQRPWVIVSGGNLTASNILANRTTGGSDALVSGGLIVNGGNVTITGNYSQGANSWGYLTINGGNLTTGILTVSATTASRGGYLNMSSGNLTVTNTTSGMVVLGNAAAQTATNVSVNFSGGTAVIERLTLVSVAGVTNAVNTSINLTGGSFYLGSGGITNNSTSGFAPTFNVNGGLLGATADWSSGTAAPMVLGSNGGTFQAADSAGVARNITLASVLSGGGALTKTGNGQVTLTANNTYSGGTTIGAGTLRVGAGGTTGSLGTGAVINNGVLSFNRSNAVAAGTVISGNGSLVQQGPGLLDLTAANTYSGGTTVSTGTLLVNNSTGSATGSGPVSLAGGVKLGGAGTIAGTVASAPGSVIVPGNSVGTLTVGGLSLAAGTLLNYEFNTSPANDLVVVTGVGGLAISGGGFNFYAEGTENPWLVTGTYNLFQFSGAAPGNLSALAVLNPVSFLNYAFSASAASNGFVQVVISSDFGPNTWVNPAGGSWGTAANWNTGVPPANATVTFANILSSNGTVTLDADRTVAGADFSSTRPYTIAKGGGGNLTLDNGGSAASLTVTFGNHTISAPVTFGAAGLAVALEPGSGLTLSGNVLATPGALTIAGNGNLTLSGTNAYSGGTSFDGSRTTFAALASLGTGALTFNGGTLVWAGGNSADISSRLVTINSGGAFLDTNGNDVALTADLGNNGTGALTKRGNGVLALGGVNTYTGGTAITGGAVEFSNLDNLGSGGVTFNGGALRWASGSTTDISAHSTVFGPAGATFDTNGNNVTLAAAVGGGGAGGLTKAGNGVLTLAAPANYTGATAVGSGTLAVGISNALPVGTNVSVAAGGTLALGTFSQTVAGLGGTGAVTLGTGGNLTLNLAADLSLTAVISGTGGFIKDGLANLTVATTNAFTGALTLSSGALILPAGASITAGAASTARNTNAELIVNGGTFTSNGAFTVNSVANTTTISGGILMQAGEAFFNGGLTLNNTQGQNSERPWVVVTGGNLTASNLTNARTSGSSTSPTGGLIISGGNVVVTNTYLQANQSWAAMTMTGGNFTASTYIASQSSSASRGGILQVSGGNFTVTSAANGGFVVANFPNNIVNITFSGGISTLEQLTLAPNATIDSGTANFNLTGGSLYIGSGGVVNNGGANYAVTVLLSGGVLGAKADWSTVVPMTIGAAGITVQAADSGGNPFAITLGGALSGAGGLTKTGGGLLALAGENTYAGPTTISAGTVQVGNGGSTGALGGGAITNNGVLAFARGDSALSIGSVIAGSGSVLQAGPGSTALTAQNTYAGGTTINGGALNVNNSAGVGVAGPVTVNSGGTLGGSGTLSGTVTVHAGGAVAPGAGTVGTLTVGSLALGVNALLNYEFNTSPANDLITVTTPDGLSIAGGGVLNLYQAGTQNPWNVAGTYSLLNFNSTAAPDVSGMQVGNALYGFDYLFGSTNTTANITITQQVLNFRWVAAGSGDWGTAANWSDGVIPNAAGNLVNLLATNTAPVAITLDGARTVGGIVFASGMPYAIDPGSGVLTLNNNGVAANLSAILGDNIIAVPLQLTGNGVTANVSASASLGLLGNITETTAAGLTKTGPGVLVLAGNNFYSGGATLAAGTLVPGSPTALGTGLLTITGGTLSNPGPDELVLTNGNPQAWNGNFGYAGPGDLNLGTGNVTLGANRTVTVSSGNLTVGGPIAGSGLSLTKAGPSTLVLGASNSYDGGTFVTSGALRLTADGALAPTAPVTVSGGTLDIGVTSLTVSALHLTGGTVAGLGLLTSATDFDLQTGSVVDTVLAGGVGLVKSGSGSATLAGGGTFTGPTTVQNGTLILAGGAENRLPSTTTVTLGGAGNTAVLQLGNSAGAATQTVAGLVAAGGSVNVVGGNTVASQLAVNLTAGMGTFSGILGDGVGNATAIGNALTLIKSGNGLLVLNGTNTYAGGTVIESGTLQVSTGANLGNVAGGLTILEGTLEATAGFTTNRTVAFGGLNGAIQVNADPLVLGTGALSGSGVLNKAGLGVLQLNNSNTAAFVGEVAIHAGTVLLGNSLALQGATLNYNNQGGAINFGNLTAATLGGLKGAENLALPANFTLSVGNDNFLSESYSGVLSGAGATFAKVGSGAISLTGNNTYTGNTLLLNGALIFSTLSNLGQGAGINFDGGALRWETAATTDISARTVTFGAGGGTFDTNGNNVAFANGVGNGGAGGMTKSGEGSLTLNGINDYSGATFVNSGTLILGADGQLPALTGLEVQFGATFNAASHAGLTVGSLSGAGALVIGSGGSLVVGGNNLSSTFAGTIADTGGAGASFVKNGTGRLILASDNTFGGATTINSGTLEVNTSLPAGSAVGVNSGGTLGGTGTVGPVTLQPGGRVAPGSSIGTLTAASLQWNGDASAGALWELSDFDNTSDLLHLLGNLTRGTGTVFLFDFQGTGYFNGADPTVYTLMDFTGSTGFSASDFSYVNLGTGSIAGTFTLNANNLQFVVTAVPEPAAWALLMGGAALACSAWRRRRRAAGR